MRSLQKIAIVFLLTLYPIQYAYSATSEPEEELKQALDQMSHGRYDEALFLLKSAEEHAEQQNDRITAVKAFLNMSVLLPQMGRTEEAMKGLIRCEPLAKGTELEGVCNVTLQSLAIETRIENSRDISDLLDLLQKILTMEKVSINKLPENWRKPMESRALTQRIYIHLQFLKAFRSQLNGKKLNDLSPSLQIFLVSAMRDALPKSLDSHPESRKKKLPITLLAKIDPTASLDKQLLKKTLELNSILMELDKADRLNLAIDISQRSDIHASLGNIPQAIALKREAVSLFYQNGSFQNIVQSLNVLAGLYLAKNSPSARLKALKVSKKQIQEFENQVLPMAGESAWYFFKTSQNIYERYLNLLLNEYNSHESDSNSGSNHIQDDLILQANRMNFRAIRRDLAIYRGLNEFISPQPELVQSLAKQREKLKASQQNFDNNINKVETSLELASTAELWVDGDNVSDRLNPVRSRKHDVVNVVDNYLRKLLSEKYAEERLPLSLQEISQDMLETEAVVMYVNRPFPDTGMSAVILSAGNQVRWVPELRDSKGKSLDDMVRDMQNQIDLESTLESSALRSSLEELSKSLWHPLGNLPENVTIILTPELIGIPFESLLLKTGEPVITAHRIRYAFGLESRIGVVQVPQTYRRAFVVGSATDNLLEARKEVEAVRRFLNGRRILVSPEDGLPAEGAPHFYRGGDFDVIHVSTHSGIDSDLARMDFLRFPHDNVYAYELSFVPLRAHLMVLSACELFSHRVREGDPIGMYPVSGISTAAMMRVAPQIVTTLWKVNPEATRIFMLRFYDALLRLQEPSAALAATKQDFLNPEKLKQWVTSAGIDPSVIPIADYKAPYYWAPFVLITSSSH
jgi:CHAT domain-containing protein